MPPVESIEEQVKDGSLYNNGKIPGSEEAKEPPSSFAGGALIAAPRRSPDEPARQTVQNHPRADVGWSAGDEAYSD